MPSPDKSARAAGRPLSVSMSASAGPSTSGPFPCDQSRSVAFQRIPEGLLNIRLAVGVTRKSRTTRCRSTLKDRLWPRGRRMSWPWTTISVSGACGPIPGGVNRLSACPRNSSAKRLKWLRTTRAVSAMFALSKLPRALAISITNLGFEVISGITRCAATSLTIQPWHSEGTAHCSSVRVSRKSASARRSSAIAAKTRPSSTPATLWTCYRHRLGRGIPGSSDDQ